MCWLFAPQTMIQNLLVPFAANAGKKQTNRKIE